MKRIEKISMGKLIRTNRRLNDSINTLLEELEKSQKGGKPDINRVRQKLPDNSDIIPPARKNKSESKGKG